MPEDILKQARKTLLKVGELLRNEAYEQAPKDTTDLARSIIVQREGPLNVAVGPTVDYGLYVHEGTGKWGPKKAPYKIKPKTKKALRFRASGNIQGGWSEIGTGREHVGDFNLLDAGRTKIHRDDLVVKSVLHPGIEPNPFMERAWAEVADKAADIFADELSDAVLLELKKIAPGGRM